MIVPFIVVVGDQDGDDGNAWYESMLSDANVKFRVELRDCTFYGLHLCAVFHARTRISDAATGTFTVLYVHKSREPHMICCFG